MKPLTPRFDSHQFQFTVEQRKIAEDVCKSVTEMQMDKLREIAAKVAKAEDDAARQGWLLGCTQRLVNDLDLLLASEENNQLQAHMEKLKEYCDSCMGSFSLKYSEACGWYVSVDVFGEPKRNFCTKDYSTQLMALEAAVAILEKDYGYV